MASSPTKRVNNSSSFCAETFAAAADAASAPRDADGVVHESGCRRHPQWHGDRHHGRHGRLRHRLHVQARGGRRHRVLGQQQQLRMEHDTVVTAVAVEPRLGPRQRVVGLRGDALREMTALLTMRGEEPSRRGSRACRGRSQ